MVNGQKVWSLGAPVARWDLLVARTDAEAPEQRGLTCPILDMAQPGIEARPLRTMAGGEKSVRCISRLRVCTSTM